MRVKKRLAASIHFTEFRLVRNVPAMSGKFYMCIGAIGVFETKICAVTVWSARRTRCRNH